MATNNVGTKYLIAMLKVSFYSLIWLVANVEASVDSMRSTKEMSVDCANDNKTFSHS